VKAKVKQPDPAEMGKLTSVSAAIDFLISVENDLWRTHVIHMHGAGWAWRQKLSHAS
jgi:hypothetical protein